MVSQAHSVCKSGKPINKHGKRVIHNGTNSVASSLNEQTNKTNSKNNTLKGTRLGILYQVQEFFEESNLQFRKHY